MTEEKKRKPQYPPPVKTPEFRKYWTRFISIVSEKQGFDTSCLKNLEILCELYVTYDRITDHISNNDLVTENEGRYGLQIKPNPMLNERQKIVGEIRHYSRLLGMRVRDTTAPEESNEWE